MTIPSHALMMATSCVLQEIELRDGYAAANQASDLLDALSNAQLQELNATAERLSRNEFEHCLRMLLRRDARLAGVSLPSLQPL